MNSLTLATKAYNNQDYQTCISYCAQILSNNQKDYQTWKLCAFALWEIGEKLKAIEYLEYSLCIFEDDISAWVTLAEMYRKVSNPQKSTEILSNFIPSTSADLYFNLARAYSDIGGIPEAIKNYQEVLKIAPTDLEAMYNLGNQYLQIKDIYKAKEMFEKASKMGHQNSKINLAYIYCKNFEENKAIQIYKNLSDFQSQNAYFYFNYANALWYSLDFEESKKMYQKAISLTPDPIFFINYAYLLLSLGEYKEGFEHYQKRLMLENILPLGVDKNRTLRSYQKDIKQQNILIYHEQGLGDSLMFSRFIDRIIPLAKNVQILVQPKLVSIFSDRYMGLVREKASQITPYDVALPLLSLPYILDIEKDLPSISGTSALQLKEIKKIGVFFTSYSMSNDSIDRSIDPQKLLECLKGFEIYSLQPEGVPKNICKQYNVVDLSSKIVDFSSTLQYLKGLDLLITIDSAIAHLAGNYGIATIVLLPKRYDWRWGKLGQDNLIDGKFCPICSPWYDCIVGIAQGKGGDWDSALEILKKYLSERIV